MLLDESDKKTAEIFELLGETETGPLLLQPLIDDRIVVGILIAGNPRSKRAWTQEEQWLGRILGQRLAIAIGNAQRFQQTFQHYPLGPLCP